MVGHLHLQGMEESLKEKSREGLLDSPDSGLPPSPSPSPPFYSLAPGILDARAGAAGASSEPPGPSEAGAPPSLPPNSPALEMRPRMLPVFFGERIEVNPAPTHEIRCNSEVKYTSEKHFRDKVFYAPVPTVTAYSETIVAAPNCTWRSYRSQLTLEPRPRALRFRSTTIIFPKHASSTFRTTLHCSLGRPRRWFTASVQLQLCQRPGPRPPAPRAPRATQRASGAGRPLAVTGEGRGPKGLTPAAAGEWGGRPRRRVDEALLLAPAPLLTRGLPPPGG
ncbi:refilin-A [Talpa occidentalis]|uniref:refilin-A n=1 Tax=Talpa occidentalis TaxID=50954 RepID=UPI00188F3B98|nr:refilin-A [Talpa occidentalis]